MSDHKLEDKFKKELDGYISPIDADALWNDMQKGKKKKFPFWWIFGGFSFLLVAGLIYFIQPAALVSNTVDHEFQTTEIDEQSQNTHDNSSNKNIDSLIKESSKDVDNKNENKVDLKQTSPNIKTQQESNKTKNETTYSETKTKSARGKSPIGSFDVSNSNELSKKVHDTFIPINESIQNGNIFDSSIERTESPVLKEVTPLDNSEQKLSETKVEKEIASIMSPALNTLNLVSLTPLLYNTIEPNYNPTWVKKISTKSSKNPKLELGLYYSYEYAFRKLSSKSDIDNEVVLDYINLRNDSETFVESYRTGVNLRKTFKGGIRASVGIEYAKLTERFDAAIDRGIVAIEDSTISAQQIFVQRTNIKKIFNRFQSINIPITVGKAFTINKWSFFIDAGVSLNLQNSARGQIFAINEVQETTVFSPDEDGSMFDNVSIGYLASAGFDYQLNKNITLELGPYWQSSLTSMSGEPLTINTRHNYAGLKLSLIKNFR